MKTSFLLFLLTGATAAFGQGLINFGNSFSGEFRAPIYGPDPADPSLSLSGQSALGNPSGLTVYGGQLLQGAQYVMALYAGPSSVTDPALLTLVTTETFRTATGNVLPAGLIFTISDLPIPGVPTGSEAKLEVRVWDVLSGADFASATIRGRSGLFLSDVLGPYSPGFPISDPDTIGWASFNVFSIPEPNAFALAGLGAAMLIILRRRPRQQSPRRFALTLCRNELLSQVASNTGGIVFFDHQHRNGVSEMKTSFLLFLLAGAAATFGQGTLNFGNRFPGEFQAPIYEPDPANPSLSLSVRSSLGNPSGSTVYEALFADAAMKV